MSGLFVDNDGRWSWKKFGYHARATFAVLLSLGILVGGGWIVYSKIDQIYMNYRYADDYPGPGGASVVVTIPQGVTVTQIGQVLVDADVVKSVRAFTKAATDAGDTSKFQAGQFRLRKQIPAATAVTMLLDKVNRVTRQVTVPPGQWASTTLSEISKQTGIRLGDLQLAAKNSKALNLPSWATNPNSPEGFLFPDTYQYGANPTATQMLGQLTGEFNSVAKSLDMENKAKALGYTPLQVLTVASIVQAEGGRADYGNVAGAIENRLKPNDQTGGLLQSDATVTYGLGTRTVQLTDAQKQDANNPYNTYVHPGLPPGPIGSPGPQAVAAAAHPTANDYLYWVTVNLDTGETKFAKTYAEHQANVAQYEQWCGANPGKCS